MFRIAIHKDDQLLTSGRYQSFAERWVAYTAQTGHEIRLVDALQPDLFDRLKGCDGFMWWFAHPACVRNFPRRLLPAIEHGLGIPVFPDWQTCWHFDDKIAQYYLLRAAGIPSPQTWVFWRQAHATAFCHTAQYPLVIKLTTGITSENVRLLKSAAEAEYWTQRLFSSGLVVLEEPSASRPRLTRLRQVLPFLFPGQPPPAVNDRTDLQRGYLLVQEFLPGNEFDTRVTVISNRAFAFRRFNRPNDFRASGSGRIDWDPAQIDTDSVRLALRVARHLQTQSLAVDVLRREQEHVISEISYYYEGWAVHACPGHWELRAADDPDTGRLEWIEGQVRPEDAILEDFLALLRTKWQSRVGPK